MKSLLKSSDPIIDEFALLQTLQRNLTRFRGVSSLSLRGVGGQKNDSKVFEKVDQFEIWQVKIIKQVLKSDKKAKESKVLKI